MEATDPLSPQEGRAALVRAIEQAAGSAGGAAALLLVSLKSSRGIGHSFGHSAAERVLSLALRRIQDTVGNGGTASRLEGSEVAVLLNPARAGRARRVAAKVQQELKDLGREHGIALGGTAVGIRAIEPGSIGEQVLQEASIALQAANATGPAGVRAYESGMLYAQRINSTIAENLQEAIRARQVETVYQPIVDLPTGAIVGAEALARWRHPVLGAVPPMDFVAVAEEIGLGAELGHLILGTALAQLRSWQQSVRLAPSFALSVNIDPDRVHSLGFADQIRQALEAAGVAPGSLALELTEASFVSGTDVDQYTLQSLRRLGVGLHIDDFGTGYSSIGYLRRIPATCVKIDRSLLGNLADPGERRFIAAVLELVRACGLDAVFEGIETQSQAEELVRLGATTGQGYHFSRPLAPEAMTRLLHAGPIRPGAESAPQD